MTALGKLLRTTVFKLSLAYLAIFAVGAGLLLGYVGYNVRNLIDEQISDTIDAEISGLSEAYSRGGIRRLVDAVERRARQPGSSLYLVTTFAGESIVGNVAEISPGALDQAGEAEISYQRVGGEGNPHAALARVFVLNGGFRLLVGRDLDDREALRRVLIRTLVSSLIWLTVIGVAGGAFVAARVLRRVDALNASAGDIMKGDLSRRLPLAGTGDELDRLALSLNAMIERIGLLMTGLREVTDNVAHDLKTPLTRLRNQAEEGRNEAGEGSPQRAAFEKIIEESDGLIRTFDALLMIARLEAGSISDGVTDFDLGAATRDMTELYEPLAEEQGVALAYEAGGGAGLSVRANRELVDRALANLIDNALKYGKAPEGDAARVRALAKRVGDSVEVEIADNGPGIPDPADRSRALDRFVRLEASRSEPGSGLGLSLAAAVARLHKGGLRLEDNGPGLRAVFSLPALPPSGAPAA